LNLEVKTLSRWILSITRDNEKCYTWRTKGCRFSRLKGSSSLSVRSASCRCSGKLLTPDIPRERLLYSQESSRNSIKAQFAAYQQQPHGAPYTSATRSPWTKRGRAMLRAERLENRDTFGLTSWKIANRVVYGAEVVRGCPLKPCRSLISKDRCRTRIR